MNIIKECPTCLTKKQVELHHEFEKLNGVYELNLYLQSQGGSFDGAQLEQLFPIEPDGKELCIIAERHDDRLTHVKIFRRPLAGAGAAIKAAGTRSCADMETEAAEVGLKVNAKWSDVQLAVALDEIKKLKK